jgi:hypothetical protein
VLSRPARFVAALAAALALAAPASASARDAPPGFYGVNFDADIALRAPAATQDDEWARMAPAGVESARTIFSWDKAQTKVGQPVSFAVTDTVVARAARVGIDVLPIVMEAPDWARENKDVYHSPPRDPNEYAAYLTALVGRYGVGGTLWSEHPELAARPIRTWQIWNEPHLRYQWDAGPDVDYAPGYGRLLRSSYAALKAADPGSTVVLAGLANTSWEYLDHLYRTGRIRGAFDVACVHPYTATVRGVVKIAGKFRAVMRKRGDARKRLWITELGLPAAQGREPKSSSPLQTTDRGMAEFLTRSYDYVIARQRSSRVGVSRVYWYSWASSYSGTDIFRYSGLRRYDLNDGTVSDKPALAAYRRSALKHER